MDAGLVVPETAPHHLAADSETEDQDPPTHEPVPDFDPLAAAEDSDSNEEPEEESLVAYTLRISPSLEEKRHFLVSETPLAKLLHHCDISGQLFKTSVPGNNDRNYFSLFVL